VWFYADCLQESFAELRAAAERVAHPASSPRPGPAPTRAAAATKA
jgi:hypothetical protein